MMGMMPGMGKMKSQMDKAGLDDKILTRQIALINDGSGKAGLCKNHHTRGRLNQVCASARPHH